MLHPVQPSIRSSLLLAACALPMLCLRTHAQTPASPELASHLHRLGVQASDLNTVMPGFTCNETIVSEVRKGGKVKEHKDFTAHLRTRRDPASKLTETFSILTAGGKPQVPGSKFSMPIYISGGFDRAITYFAPDRQACFHYTLSPGRIDFAAIPDPPAALQCGTALDGFALLDDQGNITHIERRAVGPATKERTVVSFAAVDFAPVELNGHTYRLSRHLVAEEPQGNALSHFEATYTACRLFTASVTLGAVNSTDPTEDPHPEPASPTPR